MELPTAAARANSFLAFDATGEPTVVTAGSSGAPTTITRQQFSGTGAQVAFTLASDPGALGNSCEVFIGGIYQQRDTYTIAGTTLTFTAAPVAGTDNIEVVNFLTSAIGATDSSLVTYIPAGAGATQRTVQAKLRDVVSVKDFGAVGDGVTDDRPAFQAAVDYLSSLATSGKLYVPQPTVQYALKSANVNGHGIVISSPAIHIQGEGYTQIRADVPMTAMIYVNSANSNFVKIENLILNCNNQAQNGFDSLVMGSNLEMTNVLAYDALQDGIIINNYSCVIKSTGAYRSGRYNIRTSDGTTSIVMIQAKSGSVSHAFASIKIGRSHYTTLISPFVDGANLGIEYGDAALSRAQSITIIEPGFEDVGTCLKITNAGLNIKGGYLFNLRSALYRFEFTDATVTLDSQWTTPSLLLSMAGTSNLYNITNGDTTFITSVPVSLIDANAAAYIKMPIVVVAKARTIYINGSTGNDFNSGLNSGNAIKTWEKLNDFLDGFVDQSVSVVISSTSMPALAIKGFTARNGAIVTIEPSSTCTIPGGNVYGILGGNVCALVLKNISFTNPLTVNGCQGGIKIQAGTYNAVGTNAYTINCSFVWFNSHVCTAAANFVLAYYGATAHMQDTSGTASTNAIYADVGSRVTKSGTVTAGTQTALSGGQII
jgi:hypothetical protein